MASIFNALNSFIPFADPSRPLWRDVILSAVLCTILYVAPQIDIHSLRSSLLGLRVAHENHDEPVDEPIGANPVEAPHAEVGEQAGANDIPFEPPLNTGWQGNGEAAGDDDGDPVNEGPNPHQPRPRDPNREVGAKKAKSIARRNQQRAYNEWLREQGDAQRAEWARDKEKRESELQAERERRAAIDATVREKERVEREARKTKEESERQAEIEAVRSATRMIEERLAQRKIVSVREIAQTVKRDGEWVQQLVKREGMLGMRSTDQEKETVMLTKSGWLVRVGSKTMELVYQQTASSCDRGKGQAHWDDIGRFIQTAVSKG